jgi:hypothetical protein
MDATETDAAHLLEARFHLDGRRAEFMIVGYVLCKGRLVALLPTRDVTASPSRALVSNLKYLVLMCAPRPYELLRALDSRFWSFVEVHQRLADVAPANDH